MAGTLLAAAWLVAQSPAPPPVDYEAETPPPSAWDQAQQAQGAAPERSEEGPSLLGQLARTVVALLFVVALIYLFSKLALPRLLALKPIGKPGKVLTVVERVPLDQKNALVVVDLAAGPRLLFSSGEKGVQLVGDLATLGRDGQPGFERAMARAAERQRPEEGGHA